MSDKHPYDDVIVAAEAVLSGEFHAPEATLVRAIQEIKQLRREVDALQAYAAELARTVTLGGIPPRYTSPNTVTRISRGLL